jgi:hypothetical protein
METLGLNELTIESFSNRILETKAGVRTPEFHWSNIKAGKSYLLPLFQGPVVSEVWNSRESLEEWSGSSKNIFT